MKMKQIRKKEILIRDQDRIISKIFPTFCMTRLSFPQVFRYDEDKTEDEIHFNFYEGTALRTSYMSENDEFFDLLIKDNVERRIWNVPEMISAVKFHNEVIRQQGFVLDQSTIKIGNASFYDETIGIAKNYDGNMLYMIIFEYLKKFLQAEARKPNLKEVFSTIDKVLSNINSNGKNLLRPKIK